MHNKLLLLLPVRTLWAAGLAFCLLIPAMAGAGAGAKTATSNGVTVYASLPVIRKDFPVPTQDAGILFYLQRSMNPNTIIYSANLTRDGHFNNSEPVQVYWRRFNSNGETRALDNDESIFAFGVQAVPDAKNPQTFWVNIVSYPKRKARVTLNEKGEPVAFVEMGGRQARLIYAYIQLDEGWLMPKVRHVDVFGQDTKTGDYLYERVKPSGQDDDDDDKGARRRGR